MKNFKKQKSLKMPALGFAQKKISFEENKRNTKQFNSNNITKTGVTADKLNTQNTQTPKLRFTVRALELKPELRKRKFFFWEQLNHGLLKTSYGSEFLLGSSSENTQAKWRATFLIGKNNMEIFNTFSVKVRLIALYASFKWVNSSRMLGLTRQNLKFMFASHTPVYAHLMSWAGFFSGGGSSSNRWLTGRISAQTNLTFLPNYLFVPDPDENKMITKEAWAKKIPVVSINNSDSQFTADIGVYGNNRSFKLIFKIVQLLLRLSKNQQKTKKLLLQKNKKHEKKWFTLAAHDLTF